MNSKALVKDTKTPIRLEKTILDKIKQKCGVKLNELSKCKNKVFTFFRNDFIFSFQYNYVHAEINNVSWKFDKPQGAETHFEVTVVSIDFEKMKKTERIVRFERIK